MRQAWHTPTLGPARTSCVTGPSLASKATEPGQGCAVAAAALGQRLKSRRGSCLRSAPEGSVDRLGPTRRGSSVTSDHINSPMIPSILATEGTIGMSLNRCPMHRARAAAPASPWSAAPASPKGWSPSPSCIRTDESAAGRAGRRRVASPARGQATAASRLALRRLGQRYRGRSASPRSGLTRDQKAGIAPAAPRGEAGAVRWPAWTAGGRTRRPCAASLR